MLLDTMSFIISSIILATAAHAAVHLPPSVNTTQLLGLVNDTSFNPALYRDGGGGGMTGMADSVLRLKIMLLTVPR